MLLIMILYVVKDIEQRQARREKESGKRKITDIALLKTIARYLASVIGSPVSMKSITDYLTSAGRKVSQNTVSNYVEALIESFIFYPVERFDIVGKQLLKVNNKFYMVDMGIRNHILPRKRYDLGFTIENIVYLELSRRGGKVNIGKYGSTEVDFVTQKEGVLTYYQVTADMTAEETFEREMRPLKNIQDNFEDTYEKAGSALESGDFIVCCLLIINKFYELYYYNNVQNDVNAVVVKAMKATSAMSWEEAAPILYEAMDNIMEGELDVDDDEEGGDEDGETMGFDTSQLQQMQQEMMQQAMQNIDMEQIQKMQQLAMENMQKMMAGMYGNNNNTEEDTNK